MSLKIPKLKQQQIYCPELDRTWPNITALAADFESSVSSVYNCLRRSGRYNGKTFQFLGK